MNLSKAVDNYHCCRRTRLKLEKEDEDGHHHDHDHEYYYVPDEVWLEILSRLPFKSLLICECVCKSWRVIGSYLKAQVRFFSSCGLLFNTSRTPSEITYYSFRSWKVFMLNGSSPNNNNNQQVVVPSPFDKGWLADLSFDFRGVFNGVGSFVATDNKGLFLVVHDDLTYHVHNPATKQVFTLPKSYILTHSKSPKPHEKTGFIYNWTSRCVDRVHCRFLVIRICRSRRLIEWYSFPNQNWSVRRITMHSSLWKAHWFYDNYVIIPRRTLYILTDTKFGVAIKIKQLASCPSDYVVACDIVHLPDCVRKEYHRNARLGEGFMCSTVNLSYYSVKDGAWLWELDQSSLTWTPLFVIHKQQICKTLGDKHLFEVLGAGDVVIPWAFQHDVRRGSMLLSIKSSIYLYRLPTHSLFKVAELGEDCKLTTSPSASYRPCLASLKP